MNIQNYFCSQQFANIVAKVTDEKCNSRTILDSVQKLLFASFNYTKMNNEYGEFNITGLDNFLNKLATHKYSSTELFDSNYDDCDNLLIQEYCHKHKIDEKDLANEDNLKAFKKHLAKHFGENQYMFHGTNSSFIESIKLHGINTNFIKKFSSDIEKIDNIFRSHNINRFPYKTLNSGNFAYFDTTPTNSYSYALRSPEWFSEFVGEEFYINRDYTGAKKNLQYEMESCKFTSEEKINVLNFFEKNWNDYAKQKPLIIVVMENSKYDLKELIADTYSILQDYDDAKDSINYLTTFAVDVNCYTENAIETSNSIYINMPTLEELIEKVRIAKHEEELSL